MKKISLKQQLFLFLFLFLILLSLQEASFSFFIKSMSAVIACVISDSLCSFTKTKKLKITESSLITGLIIGFVLSSSAQWWVFIAAGLLAISSKHVVRFKVMHIFNPAAIGIFLAVVIFNQATQWHGAYSWYILIPFGLYLVWRIKKAYIVFGYFLMYVLLWGIQSYYLKASFLDQLYYANYFFIFIMLIEPKTSPHYFKEKVAFGAIVSISAFLLHILKLPYDPELPALLIG